MVNLAAQGCPGSTRHGNGRAWPPEDYTIYNAGAFPCNRATEGMGSGTSVSLNFASREVVILGTQYAGEMKKGLVAIGGRGGWVSWGRLLGRWSSMLMHFDAFG